MSSSAKSFGALAHYLAKGRSGNEPERVAWSASRNLPTSEPELAGKIMRATASQNVRVSQPGYHVALSFDPGDPVDRAAMERVADRTIAALGLTGHQALIVCHQDRDHPHMHLLINRVHPETGRVWNRWQDRAVIQKVLREEEIALGLRVTPGRLARSEPTQLDLVLPEQPTASVSRERDTPRNVEARSSPAKPSLAKELRTDLDAYGRLLAVTREQYTAQLEASAARVRADTFEEAARRAHSAETVFKTGLSEVYRDPVEAERRFVALAQSRGLVAAVNTLKDSPKELGSLLAANSGAIRFGSREREAWVEGIAHRAADLGRNYIEATERVESITASAREARLRAARESLTPLLLDPAKAETILYQRSIERGAAETLATLRERPHEIAELRGTRLDAARTAILAERAALDWTQPLSSTRPKSTELPGRALESEIAAARGDVTLAQSRTVAIQRQLTALPDRSELERRILRLLDRMSPNELRHLRATLTPPQVALMLKLKSAIRDVVLGRDEMHRT